MLPQSFRTRNCVRQGDILSPHLFNVYIINVILTLIHSSLVAISAVRVRHLIHADDTVLLAPSPKVLQILM